MGRGYNGGIEFMSVSQRLSKILWDRKRLLRVPHRPMLRQRRGVVALPGLMGGEFAWASNDPTGLRDTARINRRLSVYRPSCP